MGSNKLGPLLRTKKWEYLYVEPENRSGKAFILIKGSEL